MYTNLTSVIKKEVKEEEDEFADIHEHSESELEIKKEKIFVMDGIITDLKKEEISDDEDSSVVESSSVLFNKMPKEEIDTQEEINSFYLMPGVSMKVVPPKFSSTNILDIYDCLHCYNVYQSERSLKAHVLKVHQNKSNEEQNKTYSYRCKDCNKHFNLERNFKYHERKVHGKGAVRKRPADMSKCMLCGDGFSKLEILDHIKNLHQVTIQEKDFEFESFSDFERWKEYLEKQSQSRFTRRRACFKAKSHSLYYFVCHRSGNYIPTGKGERRLKSQGSNRMNGYCPASIKVMKYESGRCLVHFIGTHVGHESDLGRLCLSNSERETIAEKIASKIPFDDILNEVRNSASESGLERIHLLTKQDMYNIESSFQLQTSATRHKQ